MTTMLQPGPPVSRGDASPRGRRGPGWVAVCVSTSGLLWFLLWFGINTGPWVLTGEPQGALETLHFLRTLGPLVALAWAVLLLLGRAAFHPSGLGGLPRVLQPWFAYGVVSLVASTGSERPGYSAYWALCYLSSFLVLWCYIQAPTARQRLDRCRYLNYAGWATAFSLLVVLLYVSRDALLVTGGQGLSGYGVVGRVKAGGGVAMVRASGFARFAAIPAIFALVFAWRGRGLRRLAWGAIALAGVALVVLMQSRGAVLGLAAAMAFAMLFMGRRSRLLGMSVLVVVAVFLVTGAGLGFDTQGAVRHLSRGSDGGDITTGRMRDWAIAWSKIAESPLWGWGPQADRYFFQFHVHNTYLYAWLAAGVFGVFWIIAGMVRAWRLLLGEIAAGVAKRVGQHTMLIQVGCILAFFSVRGLSEVSGAIFGIDLLIMLPAMAWLGALDDVVREDAAAGERVGGRTRTGPAGVSGGGG